MYDLLAIIVLFIIVFMEYRIIRGLKEELSDLRSKKQSLSTTYGQIFEQFIPFADKFPFNIKNFRFIGSPVDGIAFDDDKVVFCEIKLNKSQLSGREKRIKELVKKKRVEWFEMRG